jgi:uncharacterized protein
MDENRSWALITGASSGIGRALAHEFAAHDVDLVLTAENDLSEVAAEVAADGIQVRTVQADLRTSEGVERLWAEASAAGRIGAAALNAGIGVGGGSFLETDLEAHLDVIRLDVIGTVHLARRVLEAMVAQGSGRLLITSSLVAGMPGAYQVSYNASKSFLQSFAEGLQNELADSPVTVTSLMPGPVETDFFRRADMLDTRLGQADKEEPATVARQAYEGLMRGKKRVVGGTVLTQAMARVNAALPDAAKAKMQEILSKPKD